MATTEAASTAADIIERLRADPVLYSRRILGSDPWLLPQQILRALAKPHAQVAVKGCHASGKTHAAAQAVLWWVSTGGIAITTAPRWTQVKQLLWREIRDQHAAAKVPIGGRFPPSAPEFRIAPDAYALGVSTNEGVRFQGWHGARLLMVLDEAPGIRPYIYEAIEGAQAGGDVRLLALGNPTISSGPFYDAFTKDRTSWTSFTISAFDTPNLAGLTEETLLTLGDEELEISPRPYLTTRRWVRQKLEKWGRDHPLYAARVLGQFPKQDDQALIPLALLELAGAREVVDTPDSPVSVGIDVAGPGEAEAVAYARSGSNVLDFVATADPDPRGAIVAFLARYRARLTVVNVDEVGIGYNFMLHLRDLGFPVTGVNVGTPASNPERFANLRAEIFWGFRERAQAHDLAGVTDEETIAQATSIRWGQNARGQTVIESKDDARARGVESPDRAEALILAFMPPRASGLFAFLE